MLSVGLRGRGWRWRIIMDGERGWVSVEGGWEGVVGAGREMGVWGVTGKGQDDMMIEQNI